MEPITLFSFALIVGYIILTIVFTFTMSFQIGLIMGAFGYVIYEIVKIFLPFIKMGMNFVKFIKILFMILVAYIIFTIVMAFIPKKKDEKKKLK